MAMSCADGQVRVPADDINILSKINSPLLTAMPSQVEARGADGCGRGDGIMLGECSIETGRRRVRPER